MRSTTILKICCRSLASFTSGGRIEGPCMINSTSEPSGTSHGPSGTKTPLWKTAFTLCAIFRFSPLRQWTCWFMRSSPTRDHDTYLPQSHSGHAYSLVLDRVALSVAIDGMLPRSFTHVNYYQLTKRICATACRVSAGDLLACQYMKLGRAPTLRPTHKFY